MKESSGIPVFVLVALGGIVGNVVYVHTLGEPTDYHWVRSFVISALIATAWVSIKKHRQSHLPK